MILLYNIYQKIFIPNTIEGLREVNKIDQWDFFNSIIQQHTETVATIVRPRMNHCLLEKNLNFIKSLIRRLAIIFSRISSNNVSVLIGCQIYRGSHELKKSNSNKKLCWYRVNKNFTPKEIFFVNQYSNSSRNS